ncbi:hypothetical protein KI387_040389, partial [Taxus chinensis]
VEAQVEDEYMCQCCCHESEWNVHQAEYTLINRLGFMESALFTNAITMSMLA